MTKNEQLDQLFENWKKDIPDFAEDGIIDEVIYEQSKPKILMILNLCRFQKASDMNYVF